MSKLQEKKQPFFSKYFQQNRHLKKKNNYYKETKIMKFFSPVIAKFDV